MHLKETEGESVDWIQLFDRIKWRGIVNTEMNDDGYLLVDRPDDSGRMHLWNVGKFLPKYTA
jgi:hypothetical protein